MTRLTWMDANPDLDAPARSVDWSIGRYEDTAVLLEPAARVAVDVASPTAGERVVDVGCGTGNAALLAAARGACVIGIDPAPRLLEVASRRARARRLEATFASGDAAALPLADASADVVLSVFGVIFADNAQAAAAELARVTAPGGRIVLTAWIPAGAMHEALAVSRLAIEHALGVHPGPPFAWHDRDALLDLFAPHGHTVTVQTASLAITAASARARLQADSESHPLAIAARGVLEPLGAADAVVPQMLAILEAANEDPHAFRVTSRYAVATVLRA